MSNLKSEIIKHKANRILKYYEREGINFNTALYNEVHVKEEEKKFLFVKYKSLDFSEEFARTVIDYDNTLDYHNMLINRLAKESANKEGFLMFSKQQQIDEKEVAETESYITLTKNVLNTFLKKEDTPKFRQNVSKMNEIFQNDLDVVAEGDYGVVFYYKINSHPQFQPENKKFLENFAQQLARNKHENENQEMQQ